MLIITKGIASRATTIYGFIGAFYPLAVAATSLRFYTRTRFSGLGKDDVALLVSLVKYLRSMYISGSNDIQLLYTGLVIATIYGKLIM